MFLVNALFVGYCVTALISDSAAKVAAKTGKTVEEIKAGFAKANPQGRLIRPEEVAAAALWLVGPDSESITGQAIAVAGGEVM